MQALTEEGSSFFSPRLRPGWSMASSSEAQLSIGRFVIPVWVVVSIISSVHQYKQHQSHCPCQFFFQVPTCVATTLFTGLAAIVWLLELRSPVNRSIPFQQYPDCGSSTDPAPLPSPLPPVDLQPHSTSELRLGPSDMKIHSLASSTHQTSHEVIKPRHFWAFPR